MDIKFNAKILEFIQQQEFHIDSCIALPQDASLRQYYRITFKNLSYIVMDCSLDYNNFAEFFAIQQLLDNNGIRVPKVFLKDEINYLAIIEDLGDVKVKDLLLSMDQKQQYNLYVTIISILHKTQKIAANAFLNVYDEAKMLQGIKTFLTWYLPYIGLKLEAKECEDFLHLWSDALKHLSHSSKVLNLMDFHVENIMAINDGTFALIDFQDAMISWPAYDLVSLLQDARFDVDFSMAKELIKKYSDLNAYSYDMIYSDYNILGAQRNSRILGIFVRKYLKDGQDSYLKFLPLVLKYLDYNFSNVEALKPVRLWMQDKKIL